LKSTSTTNKLEDARRLKDATMARKRNCGPCSNNLWLTRIHREQKKYGKTLGGKAVDITKLGELASIG
jgi:hypothetical protein